MSTVIDKIIDELYRERKHCQEIPARAIDRAIKIVENHRELHKQEILKTFKYAYDDGYFDQVQNLWHMDLGEIYYENLTDKKDESMG
jgi:hypothetical protein